MNGDWVIDDCVHAPLLEALFEPVAATAIGKSMVIAARRTAAAAEFLPVCAALNADHELIPTMAPMGI